MFLLKKGAAVDCKNYDSCTAFSANAQYVGGHDLWVLLDAGTDPNTQG